MKNASHHKANRKKMNKHLGSCHCKAIKFEIEAPKEVLIHNCNCTLCEMIGFQHLIVPKSKLKLITGNKQ